MLACYAISDMLKLDDRKITVIYGGRLIFVHVHDLRRKHVRGAVSASLPMCLPACLSTSSS